MTNREAAAHFAALPPEETATTLVVNLDWCTTEAVDLVAGPEMWATLNDPADRGEEQEEDSFPQLKAAGAIVSFVR